MRSGITGRADAGTQARQFNATPTPATALHAIPDHGTPRMARQPGLRIASRSRGHCCRDDPHAHGRAGAASTLARAWQMNARHTPRRAGPPGPRGGLARLARAGGWHASARGAGMPCPRGGLARLARAGGWHAWPARGAGTPARAGGWHACPRGGLARLARAGGWHACSQARWGCQHLGASLANECQAHPSERQPQRARQPVGIAEQWTKTGQMHTRGASARKPQARTRQRARHAMRSGIAGGANTGTQARQFNATPTPATALRAIHDNGAPRPARQPGLQLASSGSGHCSRDASHDGGRAGAAAPRHGLGK
jgi:hypothetical protein